MVIPLEYTAELSLEQAEERYRKVEAEFTKFKGNYFGLINKFKKRMKEEDIRILAECSGVLLPLQLQSSVQTQVCKVYGEKHEEEALLNRIGSLETQILAYLARFKNTGVSIVTGPGCS